MAVKCREPDCRELAAEGGTYCRWHECCAPGCHERRCDAPRAYCPDHDAEHYRRTGHHAFWHETAERPAARSSPEPTPPAATSPGVQTSPEGGEPQPGEEEACPASIPRQVLQGLAIVVVAAVAFWILVLWMGSDDRDAGPGAPAGLEAPGDLDRELRLRDSLQDDKIGEALEERGYR